MPQDHSIAAVRRWIERVVVALDLCPFARRELERGSVRYVACDAVDEASLLQRLREELEFLSQDGSVETSFLIHPLALSDFYDFNEFLGECERLLAALDLDGVFQIASFHPQYQFAGTGPDDAENYSNRSPYPMLHILREESVERAIAAYPDIEDVPRRNVTTLTQMGAPALRRIWMSCLDE